MLDDILVEVLKIWLFGFEMILFFRVKVIVERLFVIEVGLVLVVVEGFIFWVGVVIVDDVRYIDDVRLDVVWVFFGMLEIVLFLLILFVIMEWVEVMIYWFF